MLIKRLSILLVALAASATVFAAEAPPGLQIKTTRPGASVTLERSLADGKALVSVTDAKQEPVSGLTDKDFTVSRPDAAGKVTSVQPIAKSVEVPRHVVLVLDNSYSMEERKAIPKLLEGVGAVLKTIRSIDDVRIVVFNDKATVKMGGRDLHVEAFQSNKPSELEAFVAKAYKKDRITDKTVLYEAMVAGLELIRGMPADDPRFLIVFSDGEDINSAFKGDVVNTAAQGVPNLRVFAIDYMQGPAIDEFLGSFASRNRGQARKAGTGADLLWSSSGSPRRWRTSTSSATRSRLRPPRLRNRPSRRPPPHLLRQPPPHLLRQSPPRLRRRPPPRLRRPCRRKAATGGCGCSS